MTKGPKFTQALREEYEQLFALAQIREERVFEVKNAVKRIFEPSNWRRYGDVEAKSRVPAHVVGIIHSLEASSNFNLHLHNGDPLSARTVRIPKGHPKNDEPPFEWSVSAADALSLHKLSEWQDWSIPGIAYVLENYNGWGYRHFHPHVKSPYLWSFTTIYGSGKYVRDKEWSDIATSAQCGGLAILKWMIQSGALNLEIAKLPEDSGPAEARPFAEHSIAVSTKASPSYPGRMLMVGSRGNDVARVQNQLVSVGIKEVGAIDQDFGGMTEWAVRLFQARSVDESGEPLEIDGIVGPKTWVALFGPDSVSSMNSLTSLSDASLLSEVLQVASSQLGVMEVPRGSNRGPEVDQYLDSAVPGMRGEPWCMAFVYWCFGRAAEKLNALNPAPRTASVLRSWEMAQGSRTARVVTAADAKRNPELVQPGMVFYIATGGRHGHTGFVADTVGGKLTTIEGNTNDSGSREGIGVFMRTRRRLDSINLGFISFG